MKNFSNQYKKILPKKAFSLTELSMVILIIGILIGGISQGIDLYKDFIKQNVKKLTLNSPVGRIPDLAAWYETTQEKFVTGTTSSVERYKSKIGKKKKFNGTNIFRYQRDISKDLLYI